MKTIIVTKGDKTASASGVGERPILDALWRLENTGGITAGEKSRLIYIFADSRSDSESFSRMESELPGLKFNVSKVNG